MSSREEAQLMRKVVAMIQTVKTKLIDCGLSSWETAAFFATKIFKGKHLPQQREDINGYLTRQIQICLGSAKQKGTAVRGALVGLLTDLEIENGIIEEYESYQPQKLPELVPLVRRGSESSVEQTPALKKGGARSFWQRLRENQPIEEAEVVQAPELNQLRNFEKELNESLMKTKMLKRIIQQKLLEEMEDSYGNRIKHINNMLALETN